jgi:hypothetical protein
MLVVAARRILEFVHMTVLIARSLENIALLLQRRGLHNTNHTAVVI